MRLACVVIAFIFVSHNPALAQDKPALHWETLNPMPVGVFDAAVCVSGGHAVLTGGFDSAGGVASAIQVLDMSTMAWRVVGQLKQPRAFHEQASLPDGRILVIGGQTTGPFERKRQTTASCEIINPRTGEVSDADALPRPISDGCVETLPDGRIVSIAGPTVEVFDPNTMKWSQTVRLRRPRKACATVLLDEHRILVIGGEREASIEEVHIDTGVSRMLAASLPDAFDDLAAIKLPDGRAWVLGGQHATGDTTDQTWLIDLSDPRNATITDGPRLGITGGMADHCVAVLAQNKWAIVLGGESQRHGSDTELNVARLLKLDDLKVYSLPPMPLPHDDSCIVTLPNGVIVLGGYRVEQGAVLGVVPEPVAGNEVHRLTLPIEK
ncbi:MAG: hypothetical protein GC164_10765 [Phycisphaera sp.]|nr:hypothetical protein [Phycisphaera sp.]